MHEIVPKKSLGQHWLDDETSLQAMVTVGDVRPGDVVIEIGPGLGTLTKYLVEAVGETGNVIALEYDQDLAAALPKRVSADTLQVMYADCLTFGYGSLPAGYKVVANIPYYLTSNLLRVLAESSNPPSSIALLVQKEVAQRVAAGPGSMSLLSVSVQLYYEATLDAVVSASLFTPPPKVDSQIIGLVRRQQPLFADLDTKLFFRIVKAGFSQRRKKLRSSLSAGLHISKEEVSSLLVDSEISPDARPQELSLQQWHQLYLRVTQS